MRTNDYSDLDLDFFANPGNNDISRKVGREAVKRSIRNLIMTNHYDRPFRSGIGSDIIKLLFEPISPFTKNLIEEAVINTINTYEPRASLVSVNADVTPDENAYNVTIVFFVSNIPEPIVTSVFLQRVR